MLRTALEWTLIGLAAVMIVANILFYFLPPLAFLFYLVRSLWS